MDSPATRNVTSSLLLRSQLHAQQIAHQTCASLSDFPSCVVVFSYLALALFLPRHEAVERNFKFQRQQAHAMGVQDRTAVFSNSIRVPVSSFSLQVSLQGST